MPSSHPRARVVPSGLRERDQIAPALESRCCFGRPVATSHSVRYVDEPIENNRFKERFWKAGAVIHANPSIDRPFPPFIVYCKSISMNGIQFSVTSHRRETKYLYRHSIGLLRGGESGEMVRTDSRGEKMQAK